MTARSLFGVATLLLTACATSSLAHHSPATRYRVGERTTVDGVLVSIVFRSPHSFLEVQARDGRNQMRVWAAEWGDWREVRARVAEGALRPGDRVVITGEPARDDGQWRIRLLRLVRPRDGWEWRGAAR